MSKNLHKLPNARTHELASVLEQAPTPEQILLDAWRWVLKNSPKQWQEASQIFADCVREINREEDQKRRTSRVI